MRKSGLLNIVSYSGALALTVLIIYLLPPIFEEYKFELVDYGELEKKGGFQRYADLDCDGNSERVILFSNINNKTAVKIAKDYHVIEQWNLDGKRPANIECFEIGDVDNDGYKEIIILIVRNDSVFLNLKEPLQECGLVKINIFIDKLKPGFEISDTQLGIVIGNDIDADGTKEIYLDLRAGFARTPRVLHMYNLRTGQIISSPYAGFSMGINQIITKKNNNKVLLSMSTSAPGNYPEEDTIKYHDRSSWFTCFNNHLEFEFEPIENPGSPSSVYSHYILEKNGDTVIIGYCRNLGINEQARKFIKTDIKGNILDDNLRNLENFGNLIGPLFIDNPNNLDSTILLWNRLRFYWFDADAMVVDSIEIQELSNAEIPKALDLDADNKNELIFPEIIHNGFRLHVTNSELELLTHTEVQYNGNFSRSKRIFSLYQEAEKSFPLLFMQVEEKTYLFSFGKNPYFEARWFIYLGIYILISSFIFFILKLQLKQLERRNILENQILNLQYNNLKSRLDDHFIFNVINSISNKALKGDGEGADYFITKLSRLLRIELNNSGSISHTLKEEIEFIESFMEIHKLRLPNFQFDIKVQSHECLSSDVPRLFLLNYVENAIKHGVKGRDNGFIQISVNKTGTDVFITIEDNGKGIGEKKSGTGHGLKIQNELFQLYEKFGYGRIIAEIDTMKNNDTTIGTKVKIKLSIK